MSLLYWTKNFYLLKIHLNLFEISNWVLKFENLISIWKSIILSENLFQTWILQSGTMCLYSSFLHAIFFYVRSLIKLCQISGNVKTHLRFQINSNGFSRHRSFGYKVLNKRGVQLEVLSISQKAVLIVYLLWHYGLWSFLAGVQN